MRVPKEHPHKLLKSVGGEGTGVIPATDIARIRAFRDFLSEDEADDRLRRQGNSGTDKIALETHIVILAMMYLPAFSDFLVFRLTCVGPASASVCAGSA
jgi:hypothetical protein